MTTVAPRLFSLDGVPPDTGRGRTNSHAHQFQNRVRNAHPTPPRPNGHPEWVGLLLVLDSRHEHEGFFVDCLYQGFEAFHYRN